MVKKKTTRKSSRKRTSEKVDVSRVHFGLSEDKLVLTHNPLSDFVRAGSMGKKIIEPKFIIMHYTAGRSFEATVTRFASSDSKVSAHLVIARNGRVYQMVPFNRPAWHAGANSSYHTVEHGRFDHLNFHSIGIELDNYGLLRRTSVGLWQTWFGRYVPAEEVMESAGYWHTYTEAQISVAERICELLVRRLGIKEIISHSMVKQGKLDPGPAFPMKSFRAAVFGRDDVEEEQEEQEEQEEKGEQEGKQEEEQVEQGEPSDS